MRVKEVWRWVYASSFPPLHSSDGLNLARWSRWTLGWCKLGRLWLIKLQTRRWSANELAAIAIVILISNNCRRPATISRIWYGKPMCANERSQILRSWIVLIIPDPKMWMFWCYHFTATLITFDDLRHDMKMYKNSRNSWIFTTRKQTKFGNHSFLLYYIYILL